VNICLCYLDDIAIYARTPQELLERLRTVLDRLQEVGLKVKPSKCELFKTNMKFLGHMVSADGIEPLLEIGQHRTAFEMLGHFSVSHRIIENLYMDLPPLLSH